MDLIDINLAKLSTKKMIEALGENGQIGVRAESESGNFGDGETYDFQPNPDLMNMLVKKEDFAVGDRDAYAYQVTWDGKQYNYTEFYGGEESHWIGNVALADSNEEDTGEPFCFISDFVNNVTLIIAAEAGEHTYNLDYRNYVYHPIDPKFIPAFDSITLNGADGKQYKLSVDESGTLVHTAIEGA